MPANNRSILELFHKAEKGLDAIDNGVGNFIIDSLCKVVDRKGCSWADARKTLGIYTVVRRVKSAKRLEKKVNGLRKEGEDITAENFYKRIPDLVGARVVCLHPDDLFRVAVTVKKLSCNSGFFRAPPSPLKMFRVRSGTFSLLPIGKFKREGFHIDEPHDVGYSSIHCVFRLRQGFETQIDRTMQDKFRSLESIMDVNECLVEIQLRTILEEAWGEVDHWIRYEDETLTDDDELKKQFKAMAAYIQAGNHHISIIRNLAREKLNET